MLTIIHFVVQHTICLNRVSENICLRKYKVNCKEKLSFIAALKKLELFVPLKTIHKPQVLALFLANNANHEGNFSHNNEIMLIFSQEATKERTGFGDGSS